VTPSPDTAAPDATAAGGGRTFRILLDLAPPVHHHQSVRGRGRGDGWSSEVGQIAKPSMNAEGRTTWDTKLRPVRARTWAVFFARFHPITGGRYAH